MKILPEVLGTQGTGQRLDLTICSIMAKKERVLVIGLGGIGSTLVPEVASLGYDLGLMDGDFVEEKNLNRQLIHKNKLGINKAISAQTYLKENFPKTKVIAYAEYLTPLNIQILDKYDLIIDGTDQVATKYLINQYCHEKKKAHLYISAVRSEGQYAFFTHQTVCLNCVYPYHHSMTKLMKCDEETSPLAVAAVSLKALNLVKQDKLNTLYLFDTKSLVETSFKITSDEHCSVHHQKTADNFFRNPNEIEAELIDLEKNSDFNLTQKSLLFSCKTGLRAFEKCMELRLEGHKQAFWTVSSPSLPL